MKYLSISFSTSILIVTGFYLLYNNLNIFNGDPFLLYIGIVLALLSSIKKFKLSYLIPGLTFIGAGIGQLIIINNLASPVDNKLIFAIAIGLSQIAIFLVTQLYSKKINTGYHFYYWPLGIGLGLIILSLIYYLHLEDFCWDQVQIYWPVIFPLLAILKYKPHNRNKRKIDLTKSKENK